ncbi:TPM domain-containing protein [Ascidiaceihabitans sp.]|nr:TPM domain-containing protein [Ascidiaceihabitans sp.]
MASIAQPYPSPISPHVNDFVQLLDTEDLAEVRGMLKSLKADTGIQMTVVTLESQAPYAPDETLEEFAANLFNDWGIGDATRNDGILVLVLPDDRAMRIELGAGYDASWNNEAGRVIDRSYLPSFRSDKYALGIKDGVADTIALLARPYAKGQPAPKSNNSPLVFIVGLFAAVAFTFRRWLGDRATKLRKCPSCMHRGALRIRQKTTRNASSTAEGSGRKTLHCTRCDHSESSNYVISRRSDSKNRGFDVGRSSGGGSSGRW